MTPAEIRAMRLALGLTQTQMAAALGVSLPTITRWEMGRSRPSPLALARLRELATNKEDR